MKNIVIVDVDGTIAKVGDRIKYLQQEPKDWDSFYKDSFQDEPIPEMVALIIRLSRNYEIVFCTGRREMVREVTLQWINKKTFGLIKYMKLLMRKDGDLRPDAIVKPELVREAGIDFNDISFVLEDRSKVVKAWRELGVRCLQVDEGDF
jgi:phosphoglycolate phosphatase-like HAD superfamily hydrolase